MLGKGKNAVAVSAGVNVLQSCEIRCIDGIYYFSNERLFSGLTEFKCEFTFSPNIFCGFDLRTRAKDRRVEWARVKRSYECGG